MYVYVFLHVCVQYIHTTFLLSLSLFLPLPLSLSLSLSRSLLYLSASASHWALSPQFLLAVFPTKGFRSNNSWSCLPRQRRNRPRLAENSWEKTAADKSPKAWPWSDSLSLSLFFGSSTINGQGPKKRIQ